MARRGPTFRAAPVHIRVPATSANLGPGFDSMGMALALWDDVIARVTDTPGLSIDVAGMGAATVTRGPRHLVARSMRAAFKELGGQPIGLEIVCANHIPHGRGLGSSAAAIVAGVMAARELVAGGRSQLPDAEVITLATAIEGHPDNVAPCVLGGLTIAWAGADDEIRVARPAVSDQLAPVAFVPGSSSSTKAVRKLIPDSVPHKDAVHNAARAALLVHALNARPDLLLDATDDLLHQPYRAPAMPRSAALVEQLRGAGVPAVISGAGPTVLALTTTVSRDEVMAEFAGSKATRGWTVLALDVDRDGAGVIPI